MEKIITRGLLFYHTREITLPAQMQQSIIRDIDETIREAWKNRFQFVDFHTKKINDVEFWFTVRKLQDAGYIVDLISVDNPEKMFARVLLNF